MLTSIRGLISAALAAVATLTASPGFADETDPPLGLSVSGNVTSVSDYRWRGISYSGGDIALQGSVQVNHKSGLYLGAWGSNLAQDTADTYGSTEVDLFAGWSGNISSGFVADVGVTWYIYPAGTNPLASGNFIEPYASLSTTLGPASAKVGVNYAPGQDALGGDDNLYIYTDLGAGISGTPISLNAHLGYTDGALSPNLLTDVGSGGGWDYSVGATASVAKDVTVGVSYIGADGASIGGFSDDTLVGTVKLEF